MRIDFPLHVFHGVQSVVVRRTYTCLRCGQEAHGLDGSYEGTGGGRKRREKEEGQPVSTEYTAS